MSDLQGIVVLCGKILLVLALFIGGYYVVLTTRDKTPVVTDSSLPIAVVEGEIEIIEEPIVQLPKTSLHVSSEVLEQGDTLVIRVDDVASTTVVSGTFGVQPLSFFQTYSDSKVAIEGIDAKAQLGSYALKISIADKVATRTVRVIERAFPVTELVVTEELEEQGYTPSSITTSIAENENPSIRSVVAEHTPQAFFTDPFSYPLELIFVSGAFGNIRKQGASALQHLGVDLDADVETPVYAINDGVVALSATYSAYGNTLVIDHGLGIYSLYLHLEKFVVKKGARVQRGEMIGLSGNSGYSIEPHLHFSIKVGGASVDPLRFIETVQEVYEH